MAVSVVHVQSAFVMTASVHVQSAFVVGVPAQLYCHAQLQHQLLLLQPLPRLIR